MPFQEEWEVDQSWQEFLWRMEKEAAPEERVFTVSELNHYLKNLLDSDPLLQQVWVRGEISRWQVYQSGHAYFTLKDANSQLRCVMWNSALRYLDFQPQGGDHVRVLGEVRVYEQGGVYQLYARKIVKEGLGELYLRYVELKRRLEAEGVFKKDEDKRPLPPFPRRIGIITSPDGAAIRDIIRIARQRHAGVEIFLFPSLVQGDEAPASLVRALQLANSKIVEQVIGTLDVLIIGRGGGSIEDLWAFNEEMVVRAVAQSRIPIVSAVGHETDFTLTDFAADYRAPTPTAAAQRVVPDRQEWLHRLGQLARRLDRAFHNALRHAQTLLQRLAERRFLRDPMSLFNEQRQTLDNLQWRLDRAFQQVLLQKRQQVLQYQHRLETLSPKAQLTRWRERWQRYANALQFAADRLLHLKAERLQRVEVQLRALNPYSVLERGYALVRDAASGRVLFRAQQLNAGSAVEIVFADGTAQATVNEVVTKDEPANGERTDL